MTTNANFPDASILSLGMVQNGHVVISELLANALECWVSQRFRLPGVDYSRTRTVPLALEEGFAFDIRSVSLRNECLPKRVVAIDQIAIPNVEPLKEVEGWEAIHLSALAAIAVPTGQDEVPDAIQATMTRLAKLPREEMVHIG